MADIHPPDHPTAPPPTVGRRLFLAGTTGAAALLATQRVPGAWATQGAWPDDPFSLGVASGDPTPTGVVLWTRLAPRPLEPDAGMPARAVPVDWESPPGRGSATWSAGAASPRPRPWPTPSTWRWTASTRAAATGTGSGPAAT
jgi:PhoD-like phosphatase, N-terminal domain